MLWNTFVVYHCLLCLKSQRKLAQLVSSISSSQELVSLYFFSVPFFIYLSIYVLELEKIEKTFSCKLHWYDQLILFIAGPTKTFKVNFSYNLLFIIKAIGNDPLSESLCGCRTLVTCSSLPCIVLLLDVVQTLL